MSSKTKMTIAGENIYLTREQKHIIDKSLSNYNGGTILIELNLDNKWFIKNWTNKVTKLKRR